MASHRPSPKLVHCCHLVVAAAFIPSFIPVSLTSLGYDSTQQDACRSAFERFLASLLPELRVAMQRHIELIGAAWGLGGADPGCAQAPEALIPLLSGELARGGAQRSRGPMLLPPPRERRGEGAVISLCGALGPALGAGRREAHLP